MPASHALILLAPFAIAAAWFVLIAILPRTMSPTEPASQPDADDEEVDAGAQPFDEGPVRGIWLVYLLYHFPVVVPVSWLRKDDTCPGWLAMLLTAVLYSGVLYLLFVRQ
jgi:hypothetical protein